MTLTDAIGDEWFPVARTSEVEAGRRLRFELLDERWAPAFSQDVDVAESQRPRRLPVDPATESHEAADAGSLAYRRWLRARGIRYGSIDADNPERERRSLATAASPET